MRSLLFVPAHDERKLAKGLACGADALIVDLEDAVPEADKPRARGICAGFVATHRGDIPLIVRGNGLATGLLLDDLAAVVRARPHAVMLPKCLGVTELALVDAYLSALEVREGIDPESIRILPIATESAKAVLDMSGYAAMVAPRLCGLLWGGEDLAADLGTMANRDPDGVYTAPYALVRSLALLASAAAKVPAIDAVYTNFRDAAGLRSECEQAVRDGFSGKAAIHPDQVAVINDMFTPSETESARARRVVETFDASPGKGAISIDGEMLDRPHYLAAQRLLSRGGPSRND
jgi:citrate lyase subunit beta/citryl-CoA lyase